VLYELETQLQTVMGITYKNQETVVSYYTQLTQLPPDPNEETYNPTIVKNAELNLTNYEIIYKNQILLCDVIQENIEAAIINITKTQQTLTSLGVNINTLTT
jgi:hypothetical protein